MKDTIEDWRERGVVRRLWRRDKSIWTSADEDKWLGWLDSVDLSLKQRLPGVCAGREARPSRMCSRSAWADRALGRKCWR